MVSDPSSIECIEQLVELYIQRQQSGFSEESLSSIFSSLSTAFGNFIFKVCNNIKYNIMIFKEFKRSVLMINVQSNKFTMNNIYNTGYSDLMNIEAGTYIFTRSPKEMNTYFKDKFEGMRMLSRTEQIYDNFMKLNAAIRNNDNEKIKLQCSLLEDLINFDPTNKSIELAKFIDLSKTEYTKFSEVFTAVSEFKEAIEDALSISSELETVLKVGKELNKIYDAFGTVYKSVKTIKDDVSFDIKQIAIISNLMNDCGHLYDFYGSLVKEYHHLEYWLSVMIDEIIKNKK